MKAAQPSRKGYSSAGTKRSRYRSLFQQAAEEGPFVEADDQVLFLVELDAQLAESFMKPIPIARRDGVLELALPLLRFDHQSSTTSRTRWTVSSLSVQPQIWARARLSLIETST